MPEKKQKPKEKAKHIESEANKGWPNECHSHKIQSGEKWNKMERREEREKNRFKPKKMKKQKIRTLSDIKSSHQKVALVVWQAQEKGKQMNWTTKIKKKQRTHQ